MARKTTGNTTRSKKAEVPVPPDAVQVAPEFQTEVRKDSGKNGKPANLVSDNLPSAVPVNLEEEIRRRAYELYLQRRATAGGENGNQNQDWLVAENEILSRYDRLARHTTA
ncbi:MAG: DUF2934 domain-containing protein [Terriglobales bacterium]